MLSSLQFLLVWSIGFLSWLDQLLVGCSHKFWAAIAPARLAGGIDWVDWWFCGWVVVADSGDS